MSDVERWEVSHDGETWEAYNRAGVPRTVAQGGIFKYARKAEPSQSVIGHVTPLPGVSPRDLARKEIAAAIADTYQKAKAPEPDHVMQFFDPREAETPMAERFCQLAAIIVEMIPRNPERTVALRKLLEAKDAVARAAIAK